MESPTPLFDQMSPTHRYKIIASKRKAVDLLKKSLEKVKFVNQNAAGKFIGLRFKYLQVIREVFENELDRLSDAFTKKIITVEQYREAKKACKKKLTDLDVEKNQISNGGAIQEDLYDEISRLKVAEESVIFDFYNKVVLAASAGQKEFYNSYDIHSKRKKWSAAVDKYYSTTREIKLKNGLMEKQRYCQLLGEWFQHELVPTAYIVPYAFRESSLDYIFGTPEENLASSRNSLSLYGPIETAFDHLRITFMPVPNSDPSEWTMYVLDPTLLDDVIWHNPKTKKELFWKDFHSKTLKFIPTNPNRPARRYLYFRHTIAFIYALDHFHHSFITKLPKGKEIWASPARPGSYLRRSVLVLLGRIIGDYELPRDILDSAFVDVEADSMSSVRDEVVASKLAQMIFRWNQDAQEVGYWEAGYWDKFLEE